MQQLTHYNNNFIRRTFPIILVCDNVTNAPNIGSLFRTADAFGVEKLILCGENLPMGRKMTKTSRATEKNVPYQVEKCTSVVIESLISEGYFITSLEVKAKSLALHSCHFPLTSPIAVVIGDENFGVSEEVLSISHVVLHIDMYGQNSSMNVVQAANICLYEITRRLV